MCVCVCMCGMCGLAQPQAYRATHRLGESASRGEQTQGSRHCPSGSGAQVKAYEQTCVELVCMACRCAWLRPRW